MYSYDNSAAWEQRSCPHEIQLDDEVCLPTLDDIFEIMFLNKVSIPAVNEVYISFLNHC